MKSGNIPLILFLKKTDIFSDLSRSKYPLIIINKLTPIEITPYNKIHIFTPYWIFTVWSNTIKIKARILIISIAIVLLSKFF